MADDLTARERALRKLPLPYSLALRLRGAGVAPEAICEYVNVDLASLAGFYRIAEAKLEAAERQAVDHGQAGVDGRKGGLFGAARLQ